MAERVYPAETITPVPQAPPPAPGTAAGPYYQQQQDVVLQVPRDGRADKSFGRPRRRRNPCCCCFSLICSLLVVPLILMVAAAVIFYFVLQPRLPKYSVENVEIREFNLTGDSQGATYLTSDVLFTVRARNPNKKIGIYYKKVQTTLSYDDVEIGEGSVLPFYQGHKNTTILEVPLQGQNVVLNKDVSSTLKKSLQDENSIAFRIHTAARVKFKLGRWKPKLHLNVRVNCDVQMTAPSARGSARLESKSCKFRLKL